MTDPQPYSFGKPHRFTAETEQRIMAWLRALAMLGAKKANKHLLQPVEFTVRDFQPYSPAEGLALLPEAAVGYALALNADTPNALIAMSRPLALTFVGGLLGDSSGEMAMDRDLTPVEDSLCQFFVQEILLSTFQETWPAREVPRLLLKGREPHPRWTRIFPPDDNVVVCALTVTGALGQGEWYLLVSQSMLLEELARSTPQAARVQPPKSGLSETARLRALVEELPVEATVILGTVQLSLAELARLSAGDVVILNQRVTEPLPATVGGEKKYRGWPGRVGSRQAFEIDSFLKD